MNCFSNEGAWSFVSEGAPKRVDFKTIPEKVSEEGPWVLK